MRTGRPNRGSAVASVGAALALVWASGASAQASAVHKTTLQTNDFPGGGRHSVLVHTEVDPHEEVAPHTHPGLEMAYVERGRALVRIRGRPDETLTAGGSFAVPPATPHSVRNLGRVALVIVSTYVVDSSQPIASPWKP